MGVCGECGECGEPKANSRVNPQNVVLEMTMVAKGLSPAQRWPVNTQMMKNRSKGSRVRYMRRIANHPRDAVRAGSEFRTR